MKFKDNTISGKDFSLLGKNKDTIKLFAVPLPFSKPKKKLKKNLKNSF